VGNFIYLRKSNKNVTRIGQFGKEGLKLVVIAIFLFVTSIGYSTNYYVSSSTGDDSNSGTSVSSAWRSLEKVNSFTPKPGDQILFKRGDEWVGTITVKASGTSGSPIVYGAYGTGNKPKIYGSEKITGWTLHSGNIYKAKVNNEVIQLFINGKRATLARYPKSGYLDITTVKSSTEFSSTYLENKPQNYYKDAIWIGRTSDYYLRSVDVVYSDGQTITLSSAPSGSLGEKKGFFLANKLEFLTQAGEWYFDASNNTVYAQMPGSDSPDNYTVRSSVKDYNVYLEKKNYVTIQDFELLEAKEHGIYINQSDYVTISNSRIINPANSGINSYYWSDHSSITGNYIYGASSYGISVYNNPGAVIQDNVIDEIGQLKNITRLPVSVWGYGIRADIGDMSIMYNRITNCGYIGISFYNGAYDIKHNYINGACQVLDDGGGIYTYTGYDYAKPGAAGSEVVGNIVFNVHGNNEGKVADHNSGSGIYLDNATHDVIVKDNLIADATNGIFLHQGGKNVVDRNTFMDCMLHLLISREYESSTITNNLVYATDRRGHPNWWGDNTHQRIVFQNNASTVFDYNTYIVPYTENDVFANKTDFTHWQTDTGQDVNSTYDGTDMKTGESEQLFYNDTKQSKTFNLGTTVYRDIYGKEVSGKFTLEPFTSKILIKTANKVQENQSPEINNQSFNLAAPIEQNDFIGQVVAHDSDADQSLGYSIVQGNELNFFAIGSTTGEITANTEIQPSEDQTYILIVKVTDNADAPLTASAEITINISGKTDVPQETYSGVEGNTEVFTGTTTAGNRRAIPVTFNESGSIESLSVYHNGGNGNMLLGVYSDQNGTPASLLGLTSATAVNSAEGWQTVFLSNPVSVNSGQKVWLSWVFENSPGIRYAAGQPARAQSSETWSAGLPAAFGAVDFVGYTYSVYCTFKPNADLPDVTKPEVTAFSIPESSSSLKVSISSFTASDNKAVTGFILTESATAPLASDAGWTIDAPTSYSFAKEGTHTLYAWVKDAAGNVSESMSDQVVINLPDVTKPAVNVLGNTEVFSGTTTAKNRRAIPVTFDESGRIESISIYHNGGDGNMLLGVYSDQSNAPGSLLGLKTSAAVNSEEGWQTVSLSNPVSVNSGQKVWLSWVFEDNPGIRYAVGQPARAQSSETWSAGMPAVFGPVDFVGYTYSVYCTFTPLIEELVTNVLGNTEVLLGTTTAGNRRAIPVTFDESGKIESLSIFHNGGAGNMLLGVYSDQNDSPGSLLGMTSSTAVNSAEGWQTVFLSNPVSVNMGQKVWLSWVFENNPGIRYAVGQPARAQSSETWSAGLPSAFGSVDFVNYTYSVYCTFVSKQTSLKEAEIPEISHNETLLETEDENPMYEVDMNNFIFYPNPAKSFITIDFSQFPETRTEIIIIDSNGRIVINKLVQSRSTRIDINHLLPGLYFIKSVNPEMNTTQKLIIQR
jgi:parallel beta-helix repeat protein